MKRSIIASYYRAYIRCISGCNQPNMLLPRQRQRWSKGQRPTKEAFTGEEYIIAVFCVLPQGC